MNIHEYQAKEIMAKEGLPVPMGKPAFIPDEARLIAEEIGKPVVIKAQVHAGGRGKSGGVKLAGNPDEAYEAARQILGMDLKGFTVRKILVEEALKIEREFYLGITLDRAICRNVIMLSPEGGMDIEEVACKNPEMIFREPLDPLLGLPGFQKNNLVCPLNLNSSQSKTLREFIDILYRLYIKYDCTLAEINPLTLLADGSFVAADAKMIIDDNALYRQNKLIQYQEFAGEEPEEEEANRRNLSYVKLSGDVGIIGNGAGLVMCTLDMIDRAGGRSANFLDIGGGARADEVCRSIELVLMNKKVRGIFINIFGGITRCDEAARGIISAVNSLKPEVPIVIRLSGTNSNQGRNLLMEAGLTTVDTMLEGASKIVEMINS